MENQFQESLRKKLSEKLIESENIALELQRAKDLLIKSIEEHAEFAKKSDYIKDRKSVV